MTDDDLERSLRDTLRAAADTVPSAPDAWDRFEARPVSEEPRDRHWRWVALPGVAVIAAAAALLFVISSGGGGPTSVSGISGRPAAVPPTTVAGAPTPVPVGPRGGPLPKGFAPASITFVSAVDGWALGSAPCSVAPCTSIARTVDGGRTWVGIPAPKATLNVEEPGTNGVTTLRFANRLDGWAFGPDLWATHDGGATWRMVSVPGVGPGAIIEDVEAGAGVVRLAAIADGGHVVLASSPVASDTFTVSPVAPDLGAGPVPTGQLVLHGGGGWFVQVDRVVISGARLVAGQWTAWIPPCADGGGPALLAAVTTTDLVAACDLGVWTGNPTGEHLFVSHDGGLTFAAAGAIPATGVSGLAASPAALAVAAADVLVSQDQGHAWATALHGSDAGGWTDLGFTTSSQGVAIDHQRRLWMTRDAGRTWGMVTFG